MVQKRSGRSWRNSQTARDPCEAGCCPCQAPARPTDSLFKALDCNSDGHLTRQEFCQGVLENADFTGASVSQRLAAVLRAEGLELDLQKGCRERPTPQPLPPLQQPQQFLREPLAKAAREPKQVAEAIVSVPSNWAQSVALPSPPQEPPPLPSQVGVEYRHGLAAAYRVERGLVGNALPQPQPLTTPSAPMRHQAIAALLDKQQNLAKFAYLTDAFHAWRCIVFQGALQQERQRSADLQTRALSQEETMAVMEHMVSTLWKQESDALKSSCLSAWHEVGSSLMGEMQRTRDEVLDRVASSEGRLLFQSQRDLAIQVADLVRQGERQRAEQVIENHERVVQERIARTMSEAKARTEIILAEQEERMQAQEEWLWQERSDSEEAWRLAQQERMAREHTEHILEVERKQRLNFLEQKRQMERPMEPPPIPQPNATAPHWPHAGGRENLAPNEPQQCCKELLASCKDCLRSSQELLQKQQEERQLERVDVAARELTSRVLSTAQRCAAEEAKRAVANNRAELEMLPRQEVTWQDGSAVFERAAEELTQRVLSSVREAALQQERVEPRISQPLPWQANGEPPARDQQAYFADGSPSQWRAAAGMRALAPSSVSSTSGEGRRETFPLPHGQTSAIVGVQPYIAGVAPQPQEKWRQPDYCRQELLLPGRVARQRMERERAWRERAEQERDARDRERAERVAQDERDREKREVAQRERIKTEQADRVERARLRREGMLIDRVDKIRSARERSEQQRSVAEQMQRERVDRMLEAATAEPATTKESCPLLGTGPPQGPLQHPGTKDGCGCSELLAWDSFSDRLFDILDTDADGLISQSELAKAIGQGAEGAPAQGSQSCRSAPTGDAPAVASTDGKMEVRIDKRNAGDWLGIEYIVEDNHLCIEAIHPRGLIALWNKQHSRKEIKIGDRIVAANGKRGDGPAILEAMRCSSKFVLQVEGASLTHQEQRVPLLSPVDKSAWQLHPTAGASPPAPPQAGLPSTAFRWDLVAAPSDVPPKAIPSSGVVENVTQSYCPPDEGFRWPTWATEKFDTPSLEVFVEDEDSHGVWVHAMPLKVVGGSAGEDTMLSARYIWPGDGYAYEQEFPPKAVRRIGSKMTAREEVLGQGHPQPVAITAIAPLPATVSRSIDQAAQGRHPLAQQESACPAKTAVGAAAAAPPPPATASGQEKFAWPAWAMDREGMVEVYVEMGSGIGRWVPGQPQQCITDEGGAESLLTVQYVWDEDGATYEQEFPPQYVRACSASKATYVL